MTDFIVHVIDPKNPNKGFRHEFTAIDHADALAQTWPKLVEAYEAEKCKEEKEIIMVFLLLNFDVPPKAWKVKLPSKVVVECEVPCPTCSGVGGVDSGGVDPQGRGIDIPCPSCSTKPTLEEVETQLKASAKVSANLDRQERDEAVKALTNFQDNVWGSLDKYSKALGWGLTGIQPECWAMLDMAVEELRKRRQNDAQIIRIIERLKCKCLSLDCTKHGSYLPEDIEAYERIVATKTLV